MAKKKRKQKRERLHTRPDAPLAKKRESNRPKDDDAELPVETSTSLPPTKKSTLPPELAHDDREINARAVGKFAAVLSAFVAVAMVAIWYIDLGVSEKERHGHTPPLPMASTQPSAPSGPLIQRVPRLGLAAFRTQELEELTTYGWVDREAGKVRIPIERAMQLSVERGLPARTAPPSNSDVASPTDSSIDPPGGAR